MKYRSFSCTILAETAQYTEIVFLDCKTVHVKCQHTRAFSFYKRTNKISPGF